MRMAFRATEGGFEDDKFALICGVAGCDSDGQEHNLMLQRSPEEEDPDEDWGVYLEVDGQGNSGYGVVAMCRLSRPRLSIDLTRQLRGLTGITGFDVELAIDDQTYSQLLAGLPRVFRELPGTLIVDGS